MPAWVGMPLWTVCGNWPLRCGAAGSAHDCVPRRPPPLRSSLLRRCDAHFGSRLMTTPLPLTAAQAGIWAGQQLDPTSPAYNAAEYIELRGPLDVPRFTAALRQTVD